jgi:hypothetical protein
MREFDEMIPFKQAHLNHNKFFPISFNDDFFYPIKN